MNQALLISYAALWVIVAIQFFAVFALYHHFGEMYLNGREGRENHGPQVGESLKRTEARGTTGDLLAVPVEGRPTVLVFVSTTCRLCAKLRGDLVKFSESRDDVNTLVICVGDTQSVDRWGHQAHGALQLIPDPGSRIASRYGVALMPFCVGVGEDGRIRSKGLVNDFTGLEVVAEHALAPKSDGHRLELMQEIRR